MNTIKDLYNMSTSIDSVLLDKLFNIEENNIGPGETYTVKDYLNFKKTYLGKNLAYYVIRRWPNNSNYINEILTLLNS